MSPETERRGCKWCSESRLPFSFSSFWSPIVQTQRQDNEKISAFTGAQEAAPSRKLQLSCLAAALARNITSLVRGRRHCTAC